MNAIAKKFLFGGDKLMPEIHSKQDRFTYRASGLFTKTKD